MMISQNPASLNRTGRGAANCPPNRFSKTSAELDLEQLDADPEFQAEVFNPKTKFLTDTSKTVISENDSPDVYFRYSLNPYRGCEHGCAYCYARPTHEYLGLNAGLDFETQIYVKENAPELYREFLSRPKWVPELVMLSGVTDCYQPAERHYRLTRACLEVGLEFRQPMGVITKNALITRDLDVIAAMAEQHLFEASISITTLDEELARSMEPRTSTPAARLRAIQQLTEAGVPVRVMVAPLIPGLNDSHVPAVLDAARQAGATSAGYVLLRLPLSVEPVFRDWLQRTLPTHQERIENLIRSTRAGNLNSAKFGERMRGTGALADQLRQSFQVFRKKYGFGERAEKLDFSQFQIPKPKFGQLRLF